MQYQLPSGKVIHISVEDYLSMSDEELRDLEASGMGEYPTSVWEGSAIKKQSKPKEKPDIDRGIDFKEDSEEVEPSIRIQSTSIAIITVDEIPPSENEDDISEEIEET